MYFIKNLIKLFDFNIYLDSAETGGKIENVSQNETNEKTKTPEQKQIEVDELGMKHLKLYGDNLVKGLKKISETEDPKNHEFLEFQKQIKEKLSRLGKEFSRLKEDRKNLLQEVKNYVEKNETKFGIDVDKTGNVEKMDFSSEKMKTITNREFLSISPEKRLQYITKSNIDSDRISSGEVKDLYFTFTFDKKYNKELYLKTTAGQVLPKEVKEVKETEPSGKTETYTRTGLKGEFFNKSNKRLTIHEGTKVEIGDLRTAENINTINAENEKKMKEYIDKPEFKGNQDILSQAISRNIDPKFIIKLFSQDKLDLPIMSIDRQTMIEDVLTEFDRVRPSIAMWNGEKFENGKYPDEFILKLTRKVNPQNYEQIAKDFGVKEEIINNFKARKNHPDYLNFSTQQEIISKAPEKLKNLIRMHFPPEEFENAILVCHGESGFNSKAINKNTDKHKSTDRGLFQINDYWHGDKYRGMDIFNPDINVKIAAQIFKEAGNSWKPWYAARKIGLA